MLAEAHPDFDDESLFQHARLILSGLLAKIHTVEWTPAVTAHPTAVAALHANWWGLEGEAAAQRSSAGSATARSSPGIPGGKTEDFGVPFALTEEFVAVYRMHPLIPDHFDFRSVGHGCGDPRARRNSTRSPGPPVSRCSRRIGSSTCIYTFGTENPGLVTLHNFPKYLQTFTRPDTGALMDLAATDILRCRELGRSALHGVPAAAAPAGADDVRRDLEQQAVGRRAARRSTTTTSTPSTSSPGCSPRTGPTGSPSATRRSGSSS